MNTLHPVEFPEGALFHRVNQRKTAHSEICFPACPPVISRTGRQSGRAFHATDKAAYPVVTPFSGRGGNQRERPVGLTA